MIDTENFKAAEFTCRCGCGLNVMSQDTVDRLQVARRWKKSLFPEKPSIRINCGCRCRQHNSSLKDAVYNSAHVPDAPNGYPEVRAVDIDFDSVLELVVLCICLAISGFKRVGINMKKKYIHCDNDRRKPDDIWEY